MLKITKAFMLLVALNMAIPAFSNNVSPKTVPAEAVKIPIGTTGKTISLKELSTISRTELENLRGKKMNFFEKMSFTLGQKKLQKNIDQQGNLSKKFVKHMAYGEGGFHFGGFALGFFVGLIGVLIAYLINDDLKRDRVKWAWIGLAIFMAIYVVLYVTVLKDVVTP